MPAIINDEQYYEAQFKQISASDQRYINVEFEGCEFVDCDFSSAQFSSCKFIDCVFDRCNLSLAQFSYSRINNVQFNECKLVGVDWTKANWPSFHADHEITFKYSILNDSSFFALTMQNLRCIECKIHDADFREADLSESQFLGCDFTHSLFHHTNLASCDFSDSQAFNIDVLENNVKQATFSRYEALYLLESLGIELVD